MSGPLANPTNYQREAKPVGVMMTKSRREFLQIARAGAMGAAFLSRSLVVFGVFPNV